MLFAVLFGWVSAGFWTALAGFLLLARGRDRYRDFAAQRGARRPIRADARTAIVMPICNEDVARVFAGLARDVRVARRRPERSSGSISSC